MAITKTIEIDVNSQAAQKDLNKVINQFDVLGKEATESIKNIEKGVESTEKSTKSLSQGFKGVGLAIKAMGIGLVLEAFNILKDLFMSNQVVADKFGAAFKTLSIMFNDFFNYINKNADGIVSFFKNIFENPVESLKNFGKLIQENIIERFNSAIEVAGFMADALKKLFEGDFEGALDSVKEAGKEMIDVFTGVDDTVGKVGDLADAAAKYASETWNAAEALQAQENAAKRAVAIQAGLVEQYDRQAEKLRQIRDNDLISIDERIKANEDLGKVLEKQEQAMLAQANLQVQAAQNQYNLNKTIENEVALIDARNNVKAVEAQIEGFRSEQIANRISLEKESLDLTKSKTQAESELATNQKLFDAERLKDEDKKLQAQKEALENQRVIELERLKSNIDLYKQGTQARLDAENEFNAKKQELDNAIIAKQDEIDANNLNKKLEKKQLDIENEQLSFDDRLNALIEREKIITEATNLSESERTKLLKENADEQKRIEEEKRKYKEEQYRNTYNNLQTILSVGGSKLNKISKALAIADVVRTAAQSVSSTVASIGKANAAAVAASPLSGGMPWVALNTAKGALEIGATIASSVKSIQAIKGDSTSAPSGGGGNSGGGGGSAPAAPSFNVVGNSGVNQIAQTLGNQQPVQAYVVANNVTTQQSLDRNIVNNASL
jgi:hypothetical protein